MFVIVVDMELKSLPPQVPQCFSLYCRDGRGVGVVGGVDERGGVVLAPPRHTQLVPQLRHLLLQGAEPVPFFPANFILRQSSLLKQE